MDPQFLQIHDCNKNGEKNKRNRQNSLILNNSATNCFKVDSKI